jgi:hypothetical protein
VNDEKMRSLVATLRSQHAAKADADAALEEAHAAQQRADAHLVEMNTLVSRIGKDIYRTEAEIAALALGVGDTNNPWMIVSRYAKAQMEKP